MKQKEDHQTIDMEDIFLWNNGSWCYRYEVDEFPRVNGEYVVVYVGTTGWVNLVVDRKDIMEKF